MIANGTYRILAVDDLEDNLFLLQTVLESEGYEVETATSGSDALAKISQLPPDLVLLDVMMPGMTGIEVTQRIRKNQKLQELPVVLITAYGESTAQQGIKEGANDYLRKPLDLQELLDKVRFLCEGQ
ncbi:response regulator [Ancylothrix sp. C2]|uniref:response regulator n=1 Tax=Ancylothrix sp. D3o TaxID=2953691 RepID=UPI0021BB38B6|nr:response regulator [Ancylothrix sp. D3o]MCT7948650.1 response regulator [Ancylothrix sp. D3o]